VALKIKQMPCEKYFMSHWTQEKWHRWEVAGLAVIIVLCQHVRPPLGGGDMRTTEELEIL
jgi:hypothetical protein